MKHPRDQTDSPSMKIWLLSSEFPHPQAGGIARYVDHIARAYVEAGMDCRVIGPTRESLETCIAEGGTPLTEPPREKEALPYQQHLFHARYQHLEKVDTEVDADEDPAYPYNLLNKDLALSYQMAQEVEALVKKEGPPDIIETQEYKALGSFLHLRRLLEPDFLAGVPLVVFLHTPDFLVEELNQEPRFKLPRYWTGRQERNLILGADALVSPSQLMADTLREKLESPDLAIKVIPLPHGPLSHYPPCPVDEADDRTLLFLGRLEPRKGVLQLLGTCENLWKRGIDFTLRMVGDSVYFHPKRRSMETFIRQKYGRWIDHGKLVLTGPMDSEGIQRELKNAGVVVLPSLWENFPNVCIEAMLAQRPVVASFQGGHAELLGSDGACGLLYDAEDGAACIKAVEESLNWSTGQRQQMGKAARQRVVERCAPHTVAQNRIAHLREVIKEFKTPENYPFPDPSARIGSVNQRIKPVPGQKDHVTVVIPFYNLGPFVEEAVDSALSSDFNDFDVLIINDGSTDEKSLSVLQNLEERRDSRIQVLHKENEGLSLARNYGAHKAKGEYLCFLDADDALLPGFLPRAVALFQRYPNVHIIASWARFFGAKKGIWASWNLEFPYLLAHNLIIPICMVRKDAFLSFGANKASMSYGLEDYEAWIGMVAEGCGGIAIPEVLTRYRVREDSMFQIINGDQFLYLYDVIVREHKALYQRHGSELFHLLNANGPSHLWAEPTSWVAPIDSLEAKARECVVAEQKKTETWWRKSVELQEEVTQARREAEKQWRQGCELRERLARLDKKAKAQAERIRELEGQ